MTAAKSAKDRRQGASPADVRVLQTAVQQYLAVERVLAAVIDRAKK